jgi:arylsulfatase A-like enzyme
MERGPTRTRKGGMGKRQPDILLLVLDTLRADRLSAYGYARETSPHLDEFAEAGVLFERAISSAQWTIPAHASFFSGEYPTTHGTTQIYDKLGDEHPTLAEILRRERYQTVGFCNNPLLGVVDNDLDRGFEAFYNYGGAFPTRPAIADSRPRLVGRFTQRIVRLLRGVTSPIENSFAHSNILLRIALHPRIVPLWRRYCNFKGNTVQSVRDLVGYLRARQRKGEKRPLFAFVNLMETHLPYGPMPRFIRRFALWYRHDQEARAFMQRYNHEHYRWMVPLTQPLTALQDRALNDLYDAEVAYQDHLLRRVFGYLADPEVRDNTMVIVTSDHGEGLNHHGFVGHSLVAYDDLVRVPLVVRYPRLYPAGKRVTEPVSARRIFHAALQAAGIEAVHPSSEDRAPVDIDGLSLASAVNGSDPEKGTVFTEAYTPDTLIALMQNDDPEAIDLFRCRSMRRAVYRGPHKLITVGDEPDELFDVVRDPAELDNMIDREPSIAAALHGLLREFVSEVEARVPEAWRSARLQIKDDQQLAERLRGLGYLS